MYSKKIWNWYISSIKIRNCHTPSIVTPPPVDSVAQNLGTSDMKDDDTLLEGEGKHTDSTHIGCGSHTLAMMDSDKNHDIIQWTDTDEKNVVVKFR